MVKFKNKKLEKLLFKLVSNIDSIIIGGSFSLSYFNYIDREINDIDIIVSPENATDCLTSLSIIKYGKFLSRFFKIKPNHSRTKIIINGVHICVFIIPTVYISVPYENITIKVDLPEVVIKNKLKYIENSHKNRICEYKHTNDVYNYLIRKISCDRLIKIKIISGTMSI